MIPILYESAFLSIQTLWVFVVIGLLIASYLSVQRLKRARVNFTLIIERSTGILVTGLITSRIIYFITHTGTYFPAFDLRTIWNFLSIWDQGFSFWGAVIGAGTMLVYRLKRSEENSWRWGDALIVPMLIGLMIGEIGAFLGGYSYGTPTNLPWAIRYDAFNVKYTVPVHPTQIYVFITILLILLSKRLLSKKTDFFKRDGNTTIYFATMCSLGFFLLEFLRGDDTLTIFSVRIPTIFFLLIFIGSGQLLYKRIKTPQYESTETPNA
ncbi:MAG: prolipoprotein diacylglyceryl transferase family protein [Candidatus Gracilibacteria bacterium]